MTFSEALEAFLRARETLKFETSKTPPSAKSVAYAERDLREAKELLDAFMPAVIVL